MRHEPRVRDWLRGLLTLVAADLSADEAKVRIAALASRLAANFPPEAFTPASFEATARVTKFFPSYAELFDTLNSWWKDNQPADDEFDATQAEDMACVRNWERHATGDWGKQNPANQAAALRHELNRWRLRRDRVFKHLVANNEQARFIAQRAGWIAHPMRAAASTVPSEVLRGPEIPDA